MNNKPFILILVYCFFLFPGSVFGIGERTITLGSTASWNLVGNRQGIIEAQQIRPHPVLVLSSDVTRAFAAETAMLDLSLSFDEGHPSRFADSQGRYDVTVSPAMAVAAAPWSRAGAGAALFTGQNGDEPIVIRPRANALFAPGSFVRDFSIEFWLFPQNLGNGEQILLWNSTLPNNRGGFFYQSIRCFSTRNRLQWTFTDFFFSPGQTESLSITVSGPPLVPRTWSHHLIRYDADLGLLEYLVDGKIEAIEYTTVSGREGGEVFTPVIGENCRFVLGNRFSGMLDEFRIHRNRLETPLLTKYPERGGRVETKPLDLGHVSSRILRIEAFGGRTESLQSASARAVGSRLRNEYVNNGRLHFSDHAEIRFFVRVSNNPHRWEDAHWVPFNPGGNLAIQGRYVQLAADFYPGWNGETSPYLSELRVVYMPAEAPFPPTRVVATARDGAVELSWRASSSRDVKGYLVFYGTASGEYFGSGGLNAFSLTSPIDAGNQTSIRIDNLNNGTLYYFAVAAYYDPVAWTAIPEPGDFSREVAARPLRMAE
jgi:hypothetical protein